MTADGVEVIDSPTTVRETLKPVDPGRTDGDGRLQLDRGGFAMLLFKADHQGPTYQRCVVTLAGTPVLGA